MLKIHDFVYSFQNPTSSKEVWLLSLWTFSFFHFHVHKIFMETKFQALPSATNIIWLFVNFNLVSSIVLKCPRIFPMPRLLELLFVYQGIFWNFGSVSPKWLHVTSYAFFLKVGRWNNMPMSFNIFALVLLSIPVSSLVIRWKGFLWSWKEMLETKSWWIQKESVVLGGHQVSHSLCNHH